MNAGLFWHTEHDDEYRELKSFEHINEVKMSDNEVYNTDGPPAPLVVCRRAAGWWCGCLLFESTVEFKKYARWTDDEVQALLSLYEDDEIQRELESHTQPYVTGLICLIFTVL